jgi:hypothetical protein
METPEALTAKLTDLLARQRSAMAIAHNGAALRRGRSVAVDLAEVDRLAVQIHAVRAQIKGTRPEA